MTEVKIKCDQRGCGDTMVPIEKMSAVICSSCMTELGWATTNEYKNNKNKARLEQERARDNKSVKRSHRLGGKKR